LKKIRLAGNSKLGELGLKKFRLVGNSSQVRFKIAAFRVTVRKILKRCAGRHIKRWRKVGIRFTNAGF
jgi:hypothetical protein